MSDHDPLIAARLELHWAARILSAAADATLDKTSDDSHSNLGWDSEQEALTGRVGARIHVPTLTLHHGPESLKLEDATLDEGLQWLGQRLDAQLTLREYDVPEPPRSGDEPFAANSEELSRVAGWFSLAAKAMSGMGELRVWPHHFDMGFLQEMDKEGHSIGGGFAIGDEHFSCPYFYVNPYGVDRPEAPPEVDHGHWTDKWFGAVLKVDAFEGSDGLEVASQFIRDAVAKSQELLAGSD